MWQRGEEALAKAIIASKLYKSMAYEAKDDDLDVEIYEEMKSYAKLYETKGRVYNIEIFHLSKLTHFSH